MKADKIRAVGANRIMKRLVSNYPSIKRVMFSIE